MQFLGDDSDIRLDLHEPEFTAWRWMPMRNLVENIVPFKRATYEEVLAAFSGISSEF